MVEAEQGGGFSRLGTASRASPFPSSPFLLLSSEHCCARLGCAVGPRVRLLPFCSVHIYRVRRLLPRAGPRLLLGRAAEVTAHGCGRERPAPAGTVPRQRRRPPERCPTALLSPCPPRQAAVTPWSWGTGSSAPAWTARCSAASSGAQPKSLLRAGGL